MTDICRQDAMGQGSRGSAAVSESLDKRLLAYALAAGAGLAAAPEGAEALIVWTNPTDVTKSASSTSPSFGFFDIDLDQNGTIDFRVRVNAFYDGGFSYAEAGAYVNVVGNGQPLGVIGTVSDASRLTGGSLIGPAQTFQGIPLYGVRLMARAYAYYDDFFGGGDSGVFGPWANAGNGFLGIKFQIGGVDHFGWAQFNVTANGDWGPSYGDTVANVSARLIDFAFEACAGQAISAGATTGGATCSPVAAPLPPSLGLLALGAAGLALWRKRTARG